MTRFTTLVLALGALSAVSCQADAPSPSERAAQRTEGVAPPAPASAPAIEPLAPTPSPAPPAVDPEAQAERMRQLLAEAGRRAEEEGEVSGASVCERAFSDVSRLLAAVPSSAGAPNRMPERNAFVGACGDLPEAAQRCMVMAYAMSHRQECNGVREGLDPAARERFGRVLGRPRW